MRHSPQPVAVDLFLPGPGNTRSVFFRKGEIIFSVGNLSDAIFFIESGNAKLTMTSTQGREAVLTILDAGDFFGEEALDSDQAPRSTNAIAVTNLRVTKINRELLRSLCRDQRACEQVMSSLVKFIAHLKDDLADNLLYASEQRLARALLSIARAVKDEEYQRVPDVTQQDLANMIGLTRQRVNALMQRFRKLGFVDYSNGLRVHNSIRDVTEKS